jgi:hypothetical protein
VLAVARRIGAGIGAVALLLLLLLFATPGYAHGGASVTIHSDGRGSIWITALWQDGHAISESMTVTMTASGGPAPVGPAVLRQTGDERGTQTYSGTLDPGAWRVSIDLAAPVDGHCQALVQVASASATPLPVEVACLVPASSPGAAPASPAGGGSLTPLWITLGGLAVLGAVTAAVLARRRSR